MEALLNWTFKWDGQWVTVQPFTDALLKTVYKVETASHTMPWQAANFQSSLHNAHHYCCFVSLGERYLAHFVFSMLAREAELLLFVINKPYQGKGFGSVLLQALIKQLGQSVQSIFLEVRETNVPARALYEKVGFCEIAQRKNYYPALPNSERERENAILYAMDIVH